MNKPVLVVMAAGMGSRYGGLKQLDPVGGHGELIIDYSIYDARRAGFETVIFVIKRELEEAFQSAIGHRLSRAMDVKYAFQELSDLPAGYAVPEGRAKPWGTCHAVLAARSLVDGPFAVINADDYYGPEGFQKIFDYLSAHPDSPGCYEFAMVGYKVGNTVTGHGSVARGVCQVDGDGYLMQVTERTRIEKDGQDARFTEDGGATWVHLDGGEHRIHESVGIHPQLSGRGPGPVPRLSGPRPGGGPPEGGVFPARGGNAAAGGGPGPGEGAHQRRQVAWRHLSGGPPRRRSARLS